MREALQLIARIVPAGIEHGVDDTLALERNPRGIRVRDMPSVHPVKMLVKARNAGHDGTVFPRLDQIIKEGGGSRKDETPRLAVIKQLLQLISGQRPLFSSMNAATSFAFRAIPSSLFYEAIVPDSLDK